MFGFTGFSLKDIFILFNISVDLWLLSELIGGSQLEIVALPTERWEDYRKIRLEALSQESPAFGSSYEEEEKFPPEVWKQRISSMLFCLEDGVPVGMISYVIRNRVKTKHGADIFSMYVKPEHRRKGIGDMLIKEALKKIEEYSEVTKVVLSVVTSQESAIRLYEKNGFKPVGVLHKELRINGLFYDELVMERLLSR